MTFWLLSCLQCFCATINSKLSPFIIVFIFNHFNFIRQHQVPVNVIYIYIKFKGPLNKRMNGHRDDWRHRRFERSPTAEHFHSADHDFLSHASVCCLEHNKEWSDSTRKLRESYWIRRLNTLCPFGINKGD